MQELRGLSINFRSGFESHNCFMWEVARKQICCNNALGLASFPVPAQQVCDVLRCLKIFRVSTKNALERG